jgi:hypothetical protein
VDESSLNATVEGAVNANKVQEPMTLTTFLSESKVMFQQLFHQNNMVLNMLAMLMIIMNYG